ncbi:hypothetical protein PALB_22920 [Pseudoalteromonas luteoviolacea B = ATCC 29581]|nr:hypothetical protein PALB_22920 [Pseudoalteromonas luteoviolacea B = ATCC 29581]
MGFLSKFSLSLSFVLVALLWPSNAQATTNKSDPEKEFFSSEVWPDTQNRGDALLLDRVLTEQQTQKILRHIAVSAVKSGQFDVATRYFDRLLKISTQPKSEMGYFAQKMLGVSAYYQGEFKPAVHHYKLALELAKQREKPLEIASIESNLGLVYGDVNQISLSLKHYLEANELYEQFGTDQDKADILLNLSGVYIRQSRLETAARMLEKAKKIYGKLGLEYGQAIVNANLGVVNAELGELETARVFFKQANAFYESTQDTRNLAIHHGNLANVSMRMGDFAQAQLDAIQGLYYAEKSQNQLAELTVLVPFAKWQLSQGLLSEAKHSIDKILALAKALNDPLKKADGEILLALLQAKQGDNGAAMRSLELFLASHRALQSQVLQQYLDEFEDNFAAEQLAQQVEELKQQQAFQDLQRSQRQLMYTLLGLCSLLIFITWVAWKIRQVEHKAKQNLTAEVEKQTQELKAVAEELRLADGVKSQFLANMSHEIRTPLTAILGHAQVLQQVAGNNPELQTSVAIIHKQGAHLHELINDILDLSKIEADQLHIQRADFDIRSLIHDLESLFEVSAQAKNLALRIEHNFERACWIREDYVRLKQILVNLLGNAIKFTEQGWVKLSVTTDENQLSFTVEDTGIGMNTQQLEVIFESFKQGDDSITRRFGGSGLGLCLSRKLSEMMQGQITVSSKVGVGSCFELNIPVIYSESQTSTQVSERRVPEMQNTKLCGTVLVAEDHPDNRALAARFLSQFGLDVIAVENGKQAVEIALSEFPDVILLDIQMPELDGLNAMLLLRKSGYAGPIFALTANVLAHEVTHYLESGFTGHFGKPFDSQTMYRELAQLLAVSTENSDNFFNVDLSDLKISFINSLEEERELLISLYEQSDWISIQSLCHKINGAAKTFECHDIAHTAMEFERALRNRDEAHFQDYYLILCDELAQYKNSKQLNVS